MDTPLLLTHAPYSIPTHPCSMYCSFCRAESFAWSKKSQDGVVISTQNLIRGSFGFLQAVPDYLNLQFAHTNLFIQQIVTDWYSVPNKELDTKQNNEYSQHL